MLSAADDSFLEVDFATLDDDFEVDLGAAADCDVDLVSTIISGSSWIKKKFLKLFGIFFSKKLFN